MTNDRDNDKDVFNRLLKSDTAVERLSLQIMESKSNNLYKIFLIRRLPKGPKESLQPLEVRRFSSSCYLNFGALREMFESYFPSLKKTVYSVLWIDEENDYIRVTSDVELLHAMQVMATPPLVKFFAMPEDEVRSVVHEDVACDGCGMVPIVGHRYECVQYESYDLCRACEHRGVHGKHNMRRHATGRGFFLQGNVQRPQPRPVPAEPSWRSEPPTSKNDTKKTNIPEAKPKKMEDFMR